MDIRDPIHGGIEITKAESAIFDSIPYQRLRAIKQLGFSEYSFPGALHNRFIHSIGVCHLAGLAFENIFRGYNFSSQRVRKNLKQCLRLGALLHDIGHGPLSHASEEVMPMLPDLGVGVYKNRRTDLNLGERTKDPNRRADHEDFTIKFVTDSEISKIIEKVGGNIAPIHVACLIDKTLKCPDDFFIDGGVDFRTILSQLVSSELDVDRMDYLERDAYFCGTNYGRVELTWILANLSYHIQDGDMYLALNRRALYSFDDFLLARHHMHLMVYFHHKSVIYEELLHRYLTSEDCTFSLPADIEEYVGCTDYSLYEHLYSVKNKWGRRVVERRPYKVLFELHSVKDTNRTDRMFKALVSEGFEMISASTSARLSKYHSATPEERSFPIYVVDQYDRMAKPYPIDESTEIFQKYEEIRRIDRLYVEPKQFKAAEKFIIDRKL